MAATGVMQGISSNYAMFSAFAFLNALGTSGVYPLAFIIGNKVNYVHAINLMFYVNNSLTFLYISLF